MATSSSLTETVLSKFTGCLVGAIIGDCYGATYEFLATDKIPFKELQKYNSSIKKRLSNGQKCFLKYTDDSLMTFDVAETLCDDNIKSSRRINAVKLGKTFAESYFADVGRGYGGHVRNVFAELNASDYSLNPIEVAAEQFDGRGSYGNGSAMRVSPVALYDYIDLKTVVDNAKINSLVTHSNEEAILGCILQAITINKVLKSLKITNAKEFCEELQNMLENCIEIMGYGNDGKMNDVYKNIYKVKFNFMMEMLDIKNICSVEKNLGNGVRSSEAVSSAIFSFLYCLNDANFDEKLTQDYNFNNGFHRTIMYAVSLAGDTDTIASMAGAIAGVYHGIDNIPLSLVSACEGTERGKKLAKHLFETQIF